MFVCMAEESDGHVRTYRLEKMDGHKIIQNYFENFFKIGILKELTGYSPMERMILIVDFDIMLSTMWTFFSLYTQSP